ncbi:hypothetical protein JCM9492_11160 [Aquifex pyrophilus]
MKKELAIELLAQGKSQKEVAEQIGVSERTIRRWLSDEEFVKKVKRRSREHLKELVFRENLERKEIEERKRKVLELLDEALGMLDYSKPMAADVLVKLLKIYTDMEEKRKDRLLDLYKKLLDTEKNEDTIEAIRVVIETNDKENTV